MAYNTAPTKEDLGKWERLSRKVDKIMSVDMSFKR